MRLLNIPHYEIKESISRNHSAAVYRAVHTLLDREVALKIITSDSETAQNDNIKRFFAEAQISANLQHHHIISIYDTGKFKNVCYFSMEYLQRGSLRKKLEEETRPPLDWSIKIILQVASALSYTHARGYIHSDIKPENILFRDTDHVVLSDFGIARRKNDNNTATQSRLIKGSPHYMAPEQALGQHIDARSDIYSLGVIFYELITGQQPYAIDNPTGFNQTQDTALQLPKGLEAFAPILEKMLATNPENRFQNIDTFRAQLQEMPAIDQPIEKSKPETVAHKKTYHKLRVLVPSIFLSLFLLPAFSIHSPPIKHIKESTPENIIGDVQQSKKTMEVIKPELIALPPIIPNHYKEEPRSIKEATLTDFPKKPPDPMVNTAASPIEPPTIPPTHKSAVDKNHEGEVDLNCILKLKSCNRQNITSPDTKE